MAFNDKYNTDDVLLRNISIGLLAFLNDKVAITQVVDNDDIRKIPVPFYYYKYGTERFLQDFYLNFQPNCDGPAYTEGNTDPVPRGAINMTSLSINTAALTNKFVRGTYNKEVDGTIQAHSAFLNTIPLTMSFDVDIISNTLVEAFKIVQEIIATFYKAATFSVDFKGFRVPIQVGFSQDYTIEKPTTFTYGDDNKVEVKFVLEMETYMPVIDATTEMHRGKTMYKGIGNVVYAVSGVSGVNARFEAEVDSEMTKIKNESVDNGLNNFGIIGPNAPKIPPTDI